MSYPIGLFESSLKKISSFHEEVIRLSNHLVTLICELDRKFLRLFFQVLENHR